MKKEFQGTRVERMLQALHQDLKDRPVVVQDLVEAVDRSYLDYRTNAEGRRQKIMGMVGSTINRHSRNMSYPDEKRELRRFIMNHADIEILLDAHDLAKRKRMSIIYVTGDRKDVIDNAGVIQITLDMTVLTVHFFAPPGSQFI